MPAAPHLPALRHAHWTISRERGPVLLAEEELSAWLNGTPDEAFCLIRTHDLAEMQIWVWCQGLPPD
jgi:putative SOS response-associated peptidase YedK